MPSCSPCTPGYNPHSTYFIINNRYSWINSETHSISTFALIFVKHSQNNTEVPKYNNVVLCFIYLFWKRTQKNIYSKWHWAVEYHLAIVGFFWGAGGVMTSGNTAFFHLILHKILVSIFLVRGSQVERKNWHKVLGFSKLILGVNCGQINESHRNQYWLWKQ